MCDSFSSYQFRELSDNTAEPSTGKCDKPGDI